MRDRLAARTGGLVFGGAFDFFVPAHRFEHAGLRAGLLAVGCHAVDATVADDLEHPPFFHAVIPLDPFGGFVVRASGEPRFFLDDAAVHVGENERFVGRSLGPHGAREDHVIYEDRVLIHDAVAVCIHELHHAAHSRCTPAGSLWVARWS